MSFAKCIKCYHKEILKNKLKENTKFFNAWNKRFFTELRILPSINDNSITVTLENNDDIFEWIKDIGFNNTRKKDTFDGHDLSNLIGERSYSLISDDNYLYYNKNCISKRKFKLLYSASPSIKWKKRTLTFVYGLIVLSYIMFLTFFYFEMYDLVYGLWDSEDHIPYIINYGHSKRNLKIISNQVISYINTFDFSLIYVVSTSTLSLLSTIIFYSAIRQCYDTLELIVQLIVVRTRKFINMQGKHSVETNFESFTDKLNHFYIVNSHLENQGKLQIRYEIKNAFRIINNVNLKYDCTGIIHDDCQHHTVKPVLWNAVKKYTFCIILVYILIPSCVYLLFNYCSILYVLYNYLTRGYSLKTTPSRIIVENFSRTIKKPEVVLFFLACVINALLYIWFYFLLSDSYLIYIINKYKLVEVYNNVISRYSSNLVKFIWDYVVLLNLSLYIEKDRFNSYETDEFNYILKQSSDYLSVNIDERCCDTLSSQSKNKKDSLDDFTYFLTEISDHRDVQN